MLSVSATSFDAFASGESARFRAKALAYARDRLALGPERSARLNEAFDWTMRYCGDRDIGAEQSRLAMFVFVLTEDSRLLSRPDVAETMDSRAIPERVRVRKLLEAARGEVRA